MFPSDLRARKEWFLPLVGGAEINRVVKAVVIKITNYTSRPYPLITVEALDSDGNFTNSWLAEFLDAMSASEDFSDGTMRDLIKYGYMLLEKMTTVTTFTAGTLVVNTHKVSLDLDSLNASDTMDGGILKEALIVYSNWVPDDLAVDHTFEAGTLK